METQPQSSIDYGGTYPDSYESLYSDSVRNPQVPRQIGPVDEKGNPRGSIHKRIINKAGINTHQVQVTIRANPGNTLTIYSLEEVIGDEFDLRLADPGGLAREDYSLTASDGSFVYTEYPGGIGQTFGGEPFGSGKILSDVKVVRPATATKPSIQISRKSAGQPITLQAPEDKEAWIRLTYTVDFKDDYIKEENKKTFYPLGQSNLRLAGSIVQADQPAARPLVPNTTNEAELTVINKKEPATVKVQNLGTDRTYKADGTLDESSLDKYSGLEGAVFELSKGTKSDGSDKSSTSRRFVGGSDGVFYIDDLDRSFGGNDTYYWLDQVSTPHGFEPMGLLGPFKVNYDGSVELVQEDSKVKYEDRTLKIYNGMTSHKGEFDIFKKDESQMVDGAPQPLPGTTFTLYWIGNDDQSKAELRAGKFWTSGQVKARAESDQDGRASFKDLDEGYYRLEETKPVDGYIKSDQVWEVKVDSEGFTSLIDVTDQKPSTESASFTNPPATSLRQAQPLATAFRSMLSPLPMARTSDLGLAQPLELFKIKSRAGTVESIDSSQHPLLYGAEDQTYSYTEAIENRTGFAESYKNPSNTSKLYSFDGEYRYPATGKVEEIKNVAGVNKYLIPTGKPGEYEVNVRIGGNRVPSDTGVVIVLDNSNSMETNDRARKTKEAVERFLDSFLDENDPSKKVALVTYGTYLIDNKSLYDFTANAEDIVSKIPTDIPRHRSGEGEGHGGTYSQGALAKARDLFETEEGKKFNNKIIITISDGVPTYSNTISHVDKKGHYISKQGPEKIGTGNRFIEPFTFVRDRSGSLIPENSQTQRPTYRPYWVVDMTKTYDSNADYALRTRNSNTNPSSYYFDLDQKRLVGAGRSWFWNNPLPEPAGGYGYRLINNHGHGTIGEARHMQEDGIEMYTIGIEIDRGSGASREDALEVMFGLSSSKDNYFDLRNVDHMDKYFDQILAELEEKNPPTVNRGILTDPMGPMVKLDTEVPSPVKLRSVGPSPIATETIDTINIDYSQDHLNLSNLNIGRGQVLEVSYKIHLDTENLNYQEGEFYDTNGPTTLQPNGAYDKKWNLPIPQISGPKSSIEFTKVWQEKENPEDRPESIQIQLQRKIVGQDDETYANVGDPVTLNEQEGWNHIFTNLIPFNSQGQVYEYRVIEKDLDDKYTVLYEGPGSKISMINRERTIQDVINDINRIRFKKIDSETREPIQGAEFQLAKDGNYLITVQSDETGLVEFEKLAPGSYSLNESSPPYGYQAPANPVKTFTVGQDGRISIGTTRPDLVEIQGKKMVDISEDPIENKPVYGEVEFRKVDGDTRDGLEGAVFKLYKENPDQSREQIINPSEPEGSYKSDAQGAIKIGRLRVGQYILEEIQAPDGYQPIGPRNFTVRQDGQVEVLGLERPADGIYEIYNYKEVTTQLGIRKLDKDKNATGGHDALSGATYKLEKLDDTGQFTGSTGASSARLQDESGLYFGEFAQLKEGVYRVEETQAPIGHLIEPSHYTFEVQSQIPATGGQKTNHIVWIKKHGPEINENTGQKVEKTIYEYDMATGQVTNKDDSIVTTIKEKEKGVEILSLKVYNKQNELKLRKVDPEEWDESDNPKVLAGVEFALYYVEDPEASDLVELEAPDKDGNIIGLRMVWASYLDGAQENDQGQAIATTDENGILHFKGLPQRYGFMEKVVYYLKETKAPEDYNPADHLIGPFKVYDDRVVYPNGQVYTDQGYEKDGLYEVNNYKKPDLYIKKIDGKDSDDPEMAEVLKGSKFQLYKAVKNDDGTYQGTDTAQLVENTSIGNKSIIVEEGQYTGFEKFEKLDNGLYWVKEVQAPAGYILDESFRGPYLVSQGNIYKAELDDQGKVTILTGADEKNPEIEFDTVANYKATYPMTGGRGIFTFLCLGTGLMALSAHYITRAKKKARDASQ